MPIRDAVRLRAAFPKSGLTYQSPFRVLHHQRRDKQVCDALLAAGYEITGPVITQLLINIFRIATPIVLSRASGESLWDVLGRVQRQIDWARGLSHTIFFELFTCLIEARYRWEKQPTEPYMNFELYNPAVLELIGFLDDVGDHAWDRRSSWILADAIIFNEMARGLDDDGNEDDNMDDEVDDIAMQDLNLDLYEDDDEDELVAGAIPPLARMQISHEEQSPQTVDDLCRSLLRNS
ncbi:hypothetical protein F4777DRAFT_597636 [Nemania sp. FL0916]|nr:hypothetical protein F4777DRAFT_597636 [Nemania sp. FL0916]